MNKQISSENKTTPEITELRRLRRELDEITGQMERQQLRRAGLIAITCHDLRTPLAVIQGYAQLLAADPTLSAHADVADYLNNILVHADALGILIENLFTLDQLERHDLRLTRERIDLIELAAQALAQAEALARVKDVTLTLDHKEIAGLWVSADAAHIGRVLYNLLSHAIKYARPAAALRLAAGQADGFAWLELRDTQRTLTPELMARLFEPAENSHIGPAALRGMDMGLVLARQVAEAHGGSAAAAGEPGGGVTLTLRLPLAAE